MKSQFKILFIMTNPTDLSLYSPIIKKLKDREKNIIIKAIDLSLLSQAFPKNFKLIMGFKNLVDYIFLRNFPDDYYVLLKELKDTDVVFTVTDHSLPERSIIQLSKQKGIKTIMLLNGMLATGKIETSLIFKIRRILNINFSKISSVLKKIQFYWYINKHVLKKKDNIIAIEIIKYLLVSIFKYDLRGDFGTDIIFCYGDFDKHILEKRSSSIIIPVGNPRIDELGAIFKELKNLKKSSSNNSLLIISSAQVEHGVWNKKMKINFFEKIISSIRKTDFNFEIRIRPHPKEEIPFLYEIVKKIEKKYDVKIVILDPKESIYKQIYLSDIIIMTASTSILDVLYLGKKVIGVDFFNEGGFFDLIKNKIPIAHNEAELSYFLNKLSNSNLTLKDQITRKNISKFFIRNYDYWDSSEQIIQELIPLLKNK